MIGQQRYPLTRGAYHATPLDGGRWRLTRDGLPEWRPVIRDPGNRIVADALRVLVEHEKKS
jgi:hypothetical protein